jgi:hypothetical protein
MSTVALKTNRVTQASHARALTAAFDNSIFLPGCFCRTKLIAVERISYI